MYKNSENSTQNIWSVVMLLCLFGMLIIYSASATNYMTSSAHDYDSMYLLKRQALFIIAGFMACIILQFTNSSILIPMAKGIYILTLGCIFLLLTPLGVSVKGATRWLNIAGIRFQVAEIVKIGVVIILAYMINRFSKYLHKIKLTLYMWIAGGGAAILLLLISNDLSSSVVVLGITFGITFLFSQCWKLHLFVFGGALAGIYGYVLNIKNNLPSPKELENMSFRVGRIAAWIAPEKYASEQGYQTLQALYAIGRGGFWGKGLGNSLQKISAIPEAQNDMIFSIICEELGIFGACLLLFLFGYLLWQIYKVTISAKTLFNSVLCSGVFLHISIQTIINIAVNVKLFPNTGIGLPFISYGGTAIFCQLLEIAMVLSVSRHASNKIMYNPLNIFKNYVKNT